MLSRLMFIMQRRRRLSWIVLIFATVVFAFTSAVWRGDELGVVGEVLCPVMMLLALLAQLAAILSLAKKM